MLHWSSFTVMTSTSRPTYMLRLDRRRASEVSAAKHSSSLQNLLPTKNDLNYARLGVDKAMAPAASPAASSVRVIPQGSSPLFTPFQLGPHTLGHRIVLAPLTRDRGTGTACVAFVRVHQVTCWLTAAAGHSLLQLSPIAVCVCEQGRSHSLAPHFIILSGRQRAAC